MGRGALSGNNGSHALVNWPYSWLHQTKTALVPAPGIRSVIFPAARAARLVPADSHSPAFRGAHFQRNPGGALGPGIVLHQSQKVSSQSSEITPHALSYRSQSWPSTASHLGAKSKKQCTKPNVVSSTGAKAERGAK